MKRAVLTAVLGTALAVPASPAQAHPLGDFTVNQYAGLHLTTTSVTIDYVLDLAELPTVAERARIETDGAAGTCARIASTARLRADERDLGLTAEPVALTFPPGTAGLATTRLECRLRAEVAITGPTPVSFEFGAYTDRLGLREITVTGDGVTVDGTTASATSRTQRLRRYPSDLLAAPLDMRRVTLTATPGVADTAVPQETQAASARHDGGLAGLLSRVSGRADLTVGIGLLAVALALLLGAGHAVAPGHGKTVMAAYLIGRKGRRREALTIAATVTATHTAGVLLLALVITASFTFVPQTLYRWLALANGVLVAGVGTILLRRAIKGTSHYHHHHTAHEPDPELVLAGAGHHHHHHPHSHSHTLHDHPVDARPDRKTVLAMGFVGGLTPSPSAVVVMLGAAALGRAWFGVVLVFAYGAGMAATLTGVGFAVARFSDRIQSLISRRWGDPVLRRLPIATGTLIIAVGLGIMAVALIDPATSIP